MTQQKKRNDLILIAVLLFLSALGFGGVKLYQKMTTDHAVASIYIDGNLTGSYPLSEDNEITIDAGDGYNRLIIQDGYAKMKEATCPDKICVNHAKINRNGQTIVCLPNKVVVEITNGQDDGVDFTTN